ncbi:MAG: hypothetical protein ABL921_11930 [Pirellula sp.]
MAHDRQRQFKKGGRNRFATLNATLPRTSHSTEAQPVSAVNSEAPSTPSSLAESAAKIESIENLLTTAIYPDPDPNAAATVAAEKTPTPDTKANESNAGVWSIAVDSKLDALVEQCKMFERERIEIEALRVQLKQATETAEARLKEANSDAGKNRIIDLETQLADVNRENAKLANLLLNARNEYQDLVNFIESEPEYDDEQEDDSEIDDCNISAEYEAKISDQNAKFVVVESELRSEITQLNEQIQFLQTELSERVVPVAVSGDEAELRIQIEKLRAQLLEARHDAVESRLQNNELSSSLAKLKGPNDLHRSEALTWEQRKEALLRQLEAETRAEEPCDPRKILEIERVLQQTDDEIIRRDREIADLRSLLEQQAIAHNGMAVGVAAVAEMIETDAMIISERMRLQEMQQEWEQKQRQAEIEMSLERAKLARERLELQEKLQQYEHNNPPQSDDEKRAAKEKTRGRWLSRLGLRDE